MPAKTDKIDGRRVRELIGAQTQRDFSIRHGKSTSWLSTNLQRARKGRVTRLTSARIAEALGVAVDEILVQPRNSRKAA